MVSGRGIDSSRWMLLSLGPFCVHLRQGLNHLRRRRRRFLFEKAVSVSKKRPLKVLGIGLRTQSFRLLLLRS